MAKAIKEISSAAQKWEGKKLFEELSELSQRK